MFTEAQKSLIRQLAIVGYEFEEGHGQWPLDESAESKAIRAGWYDWAEWVVTQTWISDTYKEYRKTLKD